MKCIHAPTLCVPHVPTLRSSPFGTRQAVRQIRNSRATARLLKLPGCRHISRSLIFKVCAAQDVRRFLKVKVAPEADATIKQESVSDAQPRPADAPESQPRASISGQLLRGNLYEPNYGLPIVRRKVGYGDLLRDIRQGHVKEISYFDYGNVYEEDPVEYNVGVDGHCLVKYHDGLVAQSFVPPFDVRAHYAMETHGVRATKLCPPPGQNALTMYSREPGFLQGKFLALLPAFLLLGTYAAVQFAQWLKGDLEDRKKIRDFDIRKEREAKQQAEADAAQMDAREMVSWGWTADQIIADLEQAKIPHSRNYIERLVEEETARREGRAPPESEEPVVDTVQQAREQAMLDRMRREAEENKSEMDKAKDMLKMRSVKIQKAIGPEDPEQEEMRIKMRKAQRQMKGVKLQYTDDSRITFDDVAGIGDSKVELTEVVDFFVKPGRFKTSGARVPKGVLLCGPPGTGKTLLARAVAGEARVAFLSLNASEFVEMFAGLGASRVRDLFAQARAIAPAIIFIDEIDAVGRKRGGASGNDERDQTLNQLLTEMDGFGEETGVIVMAATNRKDVLDSALVRPGRFDRIITVGLPDFDGRIEIMKVHLGYRPHEADIDLKELSFETQSFSGAQLANLINNAALVAAREERDSVCMQDFVRALDDDRLGPQRRAAYSPPRQHRLAVQEGATALVCTLLPAIEPVISVTIIPREKFPLGQTVVKVNEQRERTSLFTRRYLEEQLLTVLAGRAAEELVYGPDEMSTVNQRRLVLARRIVTKLVAASAMTENPAIGPRTLAYPFDTGNRRLRQIVPKRVTTATSYEADLEMERILRESYEDVKAMIQRNQPALDVLITELTTPKGEQEGVFQGNLLQGDEVRSIVARYGDSSDLARRDAEAAVFL